MAPSWGVRVGGDKQKREGGREEMASFREGWRALEAVLKKKMNPEVPGILEVGRPTWSLWKGRDGCT